MRENPYEVALRTLFDHAAELEEAAREADASASDATDAGEPGETTLAQVEAADLVAAARVVQEAIRRVMRAEIASREPRMPLNKRAMLVQHRFALSMDAARARLVPVQEEEEVTV